MRQRLVVGRGHEAVRPVALVKHAFDEERLAVEMEARYPFVSGLISTERNAQ